jgi:hypothetical protein
VQEDEAAEVADLSDEAFDFVEQRGNSTIELGFNQCDLLPGQEGPDNLSETTAGLLVETQKADYLFIVKDNPPTLRQDIVDLELNSFPPSAHHHR